MRLVKVHTLHGQFEFGLQRFCGGETYFSVQGELGNGYMSLGLKELCA